MLPQTPEHCQVYGLRQEQHQENQHQSFSSLLLASSPVCSMKLRCLISWCCSWLLSSSNKAEGLLRGLRIPAAGDGVTDAFWSSPEKVEGSTCPRSDYLLFLSKLCFHLDLVPCDKEDLLNSGFIHKKICEKNTTLMEEVKQRNKLEQGETSHSTLSALEREKTNTAGFSLHAKTAQTAVSS